MNSTAVNSTTVDWARWLQLSADAQDALWRRYRQIIKAESDGAARTNYARMNAAIRSAPHG